MPNPYLLSHGKHNTPEEGRCAMEWVSYLAGESHSDRPVCVSPTLQDFCIRLNDALPDDQRQRMRPYLVRTIGTAGDGLDGARQWMCVDWLIREYAPTFLALVPSLQADAERLRALPMIITMDGVRFAMSDLKAAREHSNAAWDAAWDAARAAAGDAAWDVAKAAAWDVAKAAAWDVAKAAAWDAAWAAAGAAAGAAARDAAWDAAGAAAGAAARDAAWDAARAALEPTVLALQESVLCAGGLLDRMLPTEVIQVPVVGDWRDVCALTH